MASLVIRLFWLSGTDSLGQEKLWVLELYCGRNAASAPVMDALDCTALAPPEFQSQLRWAAMEGDEFSIGHGGDSTHKV